MNKSKFSQSSVPKSRKKININEFMSKLYEIFEKYYFISRYLDYTSFLVISIKYMIIMNILLMILVLINVIYTVIL